MTTAFWDFSLAVYAAPGVEDECLLLQDSFGIDVNLLLFAAYTGRRGILLSRDEIAEASTLVRAWHDNVVVPLRGARRATKLLLKSLSDSTRQPAEAFRQRVKAVELASENIEQDLLDEWTRARPRLPASSDVEGAIHGNIGLLLELSGAAGQGACSPAALIRASLASAQPAGT
jgi:uncharacterized protein (TIGR02444 family)